MVVSKLCSSPNYIFADSQLIRSVGITAAALISRIHYWLQKDKGGIVHGNVKFVYNTAAQWSEQLGVSSRQVERAIAKLRKFGLLRIEKLAKHKSIRTNHYTINYEALEALVSAKKSLNMSESPRQNVGMYITKNTDNSKDINNLVNNKSKAPRQRAQEVISGPFQKINSNPKQVTQVLDIKNNKLEKNFSKRREEAKNTTVQDMLEYWKSIFPNHAIRLDREVAKHLHSAFKLKFNGDMNLWKHYCQTIETSPYLTGQGFKLTLAWALKFKTVDRIKNGELGVKNIPVPGVTELLENEVRQEINFLAESQNCKNMRLILLKRYGVHAYNAWIRKAALFEADKEIFYKSETAYGQDFIENHFGRLIKSSPLKPQAFNVQTNTVLIKERLVREIEQLEEPEKCIQSRTMLLELMGAQLYKDHIHNLSFFLENGTVKYIAENADSYNIANRFFSQIGVGK
jgi:hypothetical protein